MQYAPQHFLNIYYHLTFKYMHYDIFSHFFPAKCDGVKFVGGCTK